MAQSEYDEISINDITYVLKKRWAFILLPSVFFTIFVFAVLSFAPKKYEAYALLKIGSVGNQSLEDIETTVGIMKARPIVNEIAKNVWGNDDLAQTSRIVTGIRYTNLGGLMEVRSFGTSPEEASKIVDAAVFVIQKRHQHMFQRAQEGMDNTVKYLSEKARSVNILGNINEFKIEPTKIEIPVVSDDVPVKSKRRIAAIVAFIGIFMINTMIAFYRERKGK